jgi:hypothetical protein
LSARPPAASSSAWSAYYWIRAAVDFDPQKARGLDGALRSLAQTEAGPGLLYAAAAGLVVFGIYGMA